MNGGRVLSGMALAWCLATPAMAHDSAGVPGDVPASAPTSIVAVEKDESRPVHARGAAPGLDRHQARRMIMLLFASVGNGCARGGCAGAGTR